MSDPLKFTIEIESLTRGFADQTVETLLEIGRTLSGLNDIQIEYASEKVVAFSSNFDGGEWVNLYKVVYAEGDKNQLSFSRKLLNRETWQEWAVCYDGEALSRIKSLKKLVKRHIGEIVEV